MERVLDGANVLITGGTGTLGKALVTALINGRFGAPDKILVFSRDEAKQHDMRVEFMDRRAVTDEVIYHDHDRKLRFRIGDVRNLGDISRALDGIDVVIHAAALKQVPSCEYFPEQAIATNCVGAMNLIEAIRTTPNRVKVAVALSTDKACEPANVMGMTKALQERLFVAANGMVPSTRFVAVRYGNIVGSRGSVIPLFVDQVRRNSDVTLTSEYMTRFLMPVDHAVETVFEALNAAKAGEVVVRAAPAVRIGHLVRILIGDRKLAVKITGIRPGEKIHETLITQEEAVRSVKIGDYYFVAPMLPELGEPRPVGSGETLEGALSSDVGVLDYANTEALMKRWKILSQVE